MEREEQEESVRCLACGAECWGELERAFVFDEHLALCWDCALERGGRYDPDHESWERAPRMMELEQPAAW